MKYMTVLSILAAVSTLAGPSSTQAQDRGSPSSRSSLPQPSNEFFVGSGGIGFSPALGSATENLRLQQCHSQCRRPYLRRV